MGLFMSVLPRLAEWVSTYEHWKCSFIKTNMLKRLLGAGEEWILIPCPFKIVPTAPPVLSGGSSGNSETNG